MVYLARVNHNHSGEYGNPGCSVEQCVVSACGITPVVSIYQSGSDIFLSFFERLRYIKHVAYFRMKPLSLSVTTPNPDKGVFFWDLAECGRVSRPKDSRKILRTRGGP
jgi:hypothetical protein